MIRSIIEEIYFHSARLVPLRWNWSCIFVFRARAYFECHQEPGFRGWPWKWSMDWEAQS